MDMLGQPRQRNLSRGVNMALVVPRTRGLALDTGAVLSVGAVGLVEADGGYLEVRRDLLDLARDLLSVGVAPIVILIIMQLILVFLGMLMEIVAIMMITIPLFMPIISALGFDPVWFAVIFLLNLEMAGTSPPFGLSLFVMKSVAPPGTTMGDCYRAALPFLYCDLIAMALIIVFPQLALWLPGMMR